MAEEVEVVRVAVFASGAGGGRDGHFRPGPLDARGRFAVDARPGRRMAFGRFDPAVPPDQGEEAKQQRGPGRYQRHGPGVAGECREEARRAPEEQRQPSVRDEPRRAFVARAFRVVDRRLLAVGRGFLAWSFLHACTDTGKAQRTSSQASCRWCRRC